jgi:hypothetical protein
MLKLAKKLYSLLVPLDIRHQIRLGVYNNLRSFGILDYLRRLGLLTCKNYLPINFKNAEEALKIHNKYIQINKIIEEDKIQPAEHLEGQQLEGLQGFVATTETVLLDIADCGFSFRDNFLFNQELNAIGETRTEELDRLFPVPVYYKVLSTPTKLKGTVAYLSDPDPGNYYHWMCRTLPLLRIYQKFFDLQEIDFFYVGQLSLASFHKESLTQAGVSISKVRQEACTADRLVVAITSRSIQYGDPINKAAYLFSRNLFYNSASFKMTDKKRRIYVKRGNVNRRKLINETQVIALLKKYRFEIMEMDNKTVQEQAEIFSQAEAIVALHGAALTNLLFIQPGVKVIELIPYGYVNNCFYVIASYGEADYFYLQGEEIRKSQINVRNIDVFINIQKLERICDMASL